MRTAEYEEGGEKMRRCKAGMTNAKLGKNYFGAAPACSFLEA